jgi:antitoxin Phd
MFRPATFEARPLTEVVATSRTKPVIFERYGHPAAILSSPERYEQMMEVLEEAQNAVAFDEAMAEEGVNIPWEQVKTDLGWPWRYTEFSSGLRLFTSCERSIVKPNLGSIERRSCSPRILGRRHHAPFADALDTAFESATADSSTPSRAECCSPS